jgi:putative ABC transport system permease protein
VLRKNPGFTIMVVLILALGIGANSAIFSVVNSVVLRPLPYPNSDRLVVMWETNPRLGVARDGPSGPNFLDWKEQNRSFDDLGLIESGTGVLTGKGEPEQFPGARVTANFLQLLGAKTILGRTFSAAEGQGAKRQNVAVLTYGFWVRRFGSNRNVIGSPVTVNHELYTVIGVLAPEFWAPIRCDAFVPFPEGELRARHRDWRDFGVIGRLKPGVTLQQAQEDMNGVAARIARHYPGEEGWGVTLVRFQDALVEYIRPALLLLLASVGFVLLLACANVANLLLARMTARQREIGIRAAIGAGRTRLLRQFLTENLLLSLLGGAVGMLFAAWAVDILGRALPKTIPLPDAATEVVLPAIGVDSRVLLFTFAVSLVCAILFGVVPALSASRADLNRVLKDCGRSATGGAGPQRARRLLVISETALAFVLLIGAGLMLRTFINLQHTSAGILPDHVLTFHIKLDTDTRYKKSQQIGEFYRQVLERVRTIPSVDSAGAVDVLPLSQENNRYSFNVEGRSGNPNEFMADFRRATPDFFRTMGISLISGRPFNAHDDASGPAVAIVDETLAQRFFRGVNPLGKRLLLEGHLREIVGVIAPVKHYGLDKPAHATIYVPYLQFPSERMGLAVRTRADTRGIVAAVKQAVWAVDPDQPVFLVRPMNEYLSIATSAPRIAVLLLGIFAALAIVLAALGIYAVVSYTVSQRAPEFGLRIALGARPADVRRLILRSGLTTALMGLAIGLAAVLALAPLLGAFLYGVGTIDLTVIVSAAVFFLAVALAANYVPALRATRVDPMEALRYE